jgi:hypothetical protein
MKKLAYIFIVLSLITCKKDKLIDDKAVLIGKWEWIYSKFYREGSSPYTFYKTPNSEDATYQLNFLEKGKVQFMKDNVILEEYRIVFKSTDERCFDNFEKHRIWLNNKSDNRLIICIKNDTLRTSGVFPFEQQNEFYVGNYFIRK